MLGPNKTLLTGVEIEFHGMKYYSFDLPHLKMWKCTLPVGYKSRQWLVFLTPAPVAGLSQDYMWFPPNLVGGCRSSCLWLSPVARTYSPYSWFTQAAPLPTRLLLPLFSGLNGSSSFRAQLFVTSSKKFSQPRFHPLSTGSYGTSYLSLRAPFFVIL